MKFRNWSCVKIEVSRALNCDWETFSLVVAIIFLLVFAAGVDDLNGAEEIEAGKGETGIETGRGCGSFVTVTEEMLCEVDVFSTFFIVEGLESTLEGVVPLRLGTVESLTDSATEHLSASIFDRSNGNNPLFANAFWLSFAKRDGNDGFVILSNSAHVKTAGLPSLLDFVMLDFDISKFSFFLNKKFSVEI